MQAIIEESAAKVGMNDYLNAEPTNLSGGQKQRVAIAGILAVKPDVIVFDESASMLDPQGKASINKQIRELNKNKDRTIISITHDMDEVAQSEYVIVLENGQVMMEGTPQEIFAHQDELEKMGLALPFALKISNRLKDMGVLEHGLLSLDEVVNSLCQLKSKN